MIVEYDRPIVVKQGSMDSDRPTTVEKEWAMTKNGSSRSVLGQKRVGRSMKTANAEFGLT